MSKKMSVSDLRLETFRGLELAVEAALATPEFGWWRIRDVVFKSDLECTEYITVQTRLTLVRNYARMAANAIVSVRKVTTLSHANAKYHAELQTQVVELHVSGGKYNVVITPSENRYVLAITFEASSGAVYLSWKRSCPIRRFKLKSQ